MSYIACLANACNRRMAKSVTVCEPAGCVQRSNHCRANVGCKYILLCSCRYIPPIVRASTGYQRLDSCVSDVLCEGGAAQQQTTCRALDSSPGLRLLREQHLPTDTIFAVAYFRKILRVKWNIFVLYRMVEQSQHCRNIYFFNIQRPFLRGHQRSDVFRKYISLAVLLYLIV